MVSIKVRPRGGSCHKFLSFKGTAEPSEVIARKLLAAEVTRGVDSAVRCGLCAIASGENKKTPQDCESREVVK